MSRIILIFSIFSLIAACSQQQQDTAIDTDYQEKLLTQLLDATPGDVITIPAGRFEFNRSLSLSVDGVTLRGAGIDKTILDFTGQLAGPKGCW